MIIFVLIELEPGINLYQHIKQHDVPSNPGEGRWHPRLRGIWRHQARLAADDGVLGERVGGRGET